MPEKNIGYHNEEYQKSRHEYVEEIRTIVEKGFPEPQTDWETIWVISGPEIRFDDPPEKKNGVNQTQSRFETGLSITKKVAALRAQKDVNRLTLSDLELHCPRIYFNGLDAHNDYLRSIVADGSFEQEYDFPSEKLIIAPPNHGIQHTGDQFEKFPHDLVPQTGKLVVVSDLYHIPRVKRYFNKYPITPIENVVLYPAKPMILSVSRALNEAKKIYPYTQQGIL